MNTCDCIVIGLGGLGSSALAHLARRGADVIGIEHFGPAHDRGSSHGETRIIRQAYFEHPDYVPLLKEAYRLWRELEVESGKSLMVLNGLVLSGPPAGTAVEGALRSAREHHLLVESLDARAARAQFPMFRFPDDHTVVFEPRAGYLHVERCVQAALQQAQRNGARAMFHEPIRGWRPDRQLYVIDTDRGEYAAPRVLFTAGAWMGHLLGSALPQLDVLRKVQFWHPLQGDSPSPAGTWPAFFFELQQGSFYGLPAVERQEVKVAEHSGGTPVADPSSLTRELEPGDATAVEAFAAQHLSGVGSSAVRHSACMYTMSPDGHFLIDQHPDHPGLYFAAGFSGHGFKFASVLGKALAELVLDQRTQLPIGFLRLGRFGSDTHQSAGTRAGTHRS